MSCPNLAERVKRVFLSCRTPAQLQVAERYLTLAWPRLDRQERWGMLGDLVDAGRAEVLIWGVNHD